LAPNEIPINRFVKILISADVEPTAAKAWLPLNLPTTMISTALNISCRMLVSISGKAKVTSLSIMEPLHMSISYLFFFTVRSPFLMMSHSIILPRSFDRGFPDLFLVFLIQNRQPLQEQIVIQNDLSSAVGHDLFCKSACSNDCHIGAKLFFHPVDDSVDGRCTAVDNPALHAFDRIFPDQMLRRFQTDAGQLCRPCRQGIQ